VKAWDKLKPTDDIYKAIMDGLEKWVEYWDERNEPDFIPHPATWINKRRWESEPPKRESKSDPLAHLKKLYDELGDD
jgi:hypothetical protein